jgi:hypothetical protein
MVLDFFLKIIFLLDILKGNKQTAAPALLSFFVRSIAFSKGCSKQTSTGAESEDGGRTTPAKNHVGTNVDWETTTPEVALIRMPR